MLVINYGSLKYISYRSHDWAICWTVSNLYISFHALERIFACTSLILYIVSAPLSRYVQLSRHKKWHSLKKYRELDHFHAFPYRLKVSKEASPNQTNISIIENKTSQNILLWGGLKMSRVVSIVTLAY